VPEETVDADDLVAGGEQVRNDGLHERALGTGDDDTHGNFDLYLSVVRRKGGAAVSR
jgi:hypothetical protein